MKNNSQSRSLRARMDGDEDFFMNYREELKAGGIATANKLEKMESVIDN